MRFGVLGPLTVWGVDGEPVRVPEAKVRALLADLLLHEGRSVSVDRLVEDLWGDDIPGKPANALQAKVSQLRRALGRERVVREQSGYRLRLDASDDVDADVFRSLVARAAQLGQPAARAGLLTESLELWRGPAYADFADQEFVRTAAERLAEERLIALEERARARLAAGEHAGLTGELAELVASHPLRERLRAVQLRALVSAGRQGEALASYADLRERLAEELGVDPSPELAALHAAILRQDESLAVPAPPAAPLGGSQRTNLPVPLTALVGRGRSVEQVGRLLDSARLVTLTGPGGVGKTRLAVEAAGRLVRAAEAGVPEGVWLVELAGHRGGVTDLVRAISGVLGVRDDGGSGQLATRLAAAVRDRRTLLVLDNCEHVVEAAAELTDLLLRSAPGLRVLATSQEPLGLAGEAVFLVEPLDPADAVQLFATRAAAAAPGFTLAGATRETQEAVAEICRRLDGIPLALELAATRVRGLGVQELAARLGDRFRLLGSGHRGAPARQQTLRAMIDWSWQLLDASDRAVLRRLAVHVDGCTLDAAEAVCAGGAVRREDVLDLVTRLVDRSLVVMVDGPAGTAPRYRMLESVAAYASERLRKSEDAAGVAERHLRYYLDLAERAEPHLRDGEQRAWLRRLDAESANLRSALAEAVRRAGLDDEAAAEEAERLATALTWWWLLRGRLGDAYRALSAVLEVAPGATEVQVLRGAFALLTGDRSAAVPLPDSTTGSTTGSADPLRRARAGWLHAYGLFNVGDPVASEDANARALDLFTAADDRWGTAAALGLRGMHALVRGDLTTIEHDGLRGARLFAEVGDRWGELQTVQPLAALAEIRGAYDEAARRQHDGLRIAEELGLWTEVSARLSGLGRLALLRADWERAHDLHERARRLAAEQGYTYGEIHAEMGLALGARRCGDLDAAQGYLVRIRDGHAGVSSKIGDHLLLAELGFLAELRRDADAATANHLRGLEIGAALREPRALALSLEGIAGAATLSGDAAHADRAGLLLGAADAARRSVGAPLPAAERGDVDRIATAATAVLGGAAFDDAFRRGAQLSLAEAVRVARATRNAPDAPDVRDVRATGDEP
ncbi:BTAD domain-containing putative transcriptional regulator [Actinopolymorpha pittospori]|uniref:ATPase/DNA-binding SARP family transcriptional activator n=1 Tax=Actinopolymorpha pittospori TaxID=648752 RepID=A0A927MUB0_9ACTN|nr:BTAD domain-containing putative transcriptional regulator [Actinopolymorpha pittospori]MBE1607040.1 putative ATPase/DNA-binding SARP family transcriptional activator [Actinopolymorpha pittospori]